MFCQTKNLFPDMYGHVAGPIRRSKPISSTCHISTAEVLRRNTSEALDGRPGWKSSLLWLPPTIAELLKPLPFPFRSESNTMRSTSSQNRRTDVRRGSNLRLGGDIKSERTLRALTSVSTNPRQDVPEVARNSWKIIVDLSMSSCH